MSASGPGASGWASVTAASWPGRDEDARVNALLVLGVTTVVLFTGGSLVWVGLQGPLADGCRVHVENRATSAVAYAVTWNDRVVEGVLPPGGSEVVRVCTVLLGAAPEVTVRSAERGSASMSLNAHCDDPVFVVRADGVQALPRTCG